MLKNFCRLWVCWLAWSFLSAGLFAQSTHKYVVLDAFAPELLAELNRSSENLSLAKLAFATRALSNADLIKAQMYRSIVKVIEEDLDSDRRLDVAAGVGMSYAHRQFDARWLSSDKTWFELVGIVNRLDRYPFAPEKCGETRLIYRLAYRSEVKGVVIRSRLPMTINLVFWQTGSNCQQVAQRWFAPDRNATHSVGWWLGSDGPLNAGRLERSHLKSLEINFQSVRWPSTVHPGLGGHAEYILRVFKPAADEYRAAPLENTPDVARLKREPELARKFLGWLQASAQKQALVDGTLTVPETYLAKRAVSVTPRGLARLANRPYSQLFKDSDFTASGASPVNSGKAVLRRLNGLSCQGCHQSQSVAGFHVLGDDATEQRLDALAVSTSPHYHGENQRRRAVLLALSEGKIPSETRPLADFTASNAFAARCSLRLDDFKEFRCAEGFRCQQLDDNDLGFCVEEQVTQAIGAACEVGKLRTYQRGADDRIKSPKVLSCGRNAYCLGNAVGFPQGMCTGECDTDTPGQACGAIVQLDGFNTCLAKKRPFTECILETAQPTGLRECSQTFHCREDYICARSPYEKAGVCIPPYFLFQLRVDGHVL